MGRYVFKRLVLLVPVLLGVVFIIFCLNEISPGDPARLLAGDYATEEDIQNLREEMGLDEPFLSRFCSYVYGIITRGDFGTSYATKRPVLDEVMDRFPTTLLLACLSTLIMLVIGIATGIVSATRQYSWIDNLCNAIGLVGVSMPNFWQGLMNILLFSIYLGWFPSSGFYGPQYWVLPAVTIGTSNACTIMRMTRSSMLEVLHQDYITSARAKGLSEGTIVRKHALKNALIPILTVVGMTFGTLLGGALVTETVFAIPGLGKYMVDAIKLRDYPVIQGGVLIMAIISSLVTLGVDILYAFIDPQIRSMYRSKKNRAKEAAQNG
ncbi:MAG: ABC transporter permease [Clostridia bacterium]|nr:ABC transporter permease [Clostridia bacterium]